jgi:hypothetical protein
MAEAAGNPTIDGMKTAGQWTPAPDAAAALDPGATPADIRAVLPAEAVRDRGLPFPTANDEENRHALSR